MHESSRFTAAVEPNQQINAYLFYENEIIWPIHISPIRYSPKIA